MIIMVGVKMVHRNDSNCDRFFYENYRHKDHYADLPAGPRKTRNKTMSRADAVLTIIGIID